MTKQEWHKLVRAAVGGSPEAFETIYQTKAKTILAYARKLVYDPSAAEDAAQEIVLRMYKSIGQLHSPEAFNVWMYRIILGTCQRFNQQNPVHNNANLDDVHNEPEESETQYLPAQAVEAAERNRLIAQAIHSLPQQQRLALTMYYYDEMSYKEIAQVLGITTSGVAGNLLKAKKALKMKLLPTSSGANAAKALPGIALVPAIRKALRVDMDLAAPPQLVQGMIKQCSENLALGTAHGAAASATANRGAGKLVKLMIVIVGSLLVGAGILFATVPTLQNRHHTIHAEIIMENTVQGASEHINPLGVRIRIPAGEGRAVRWYLQDSLGRCLHTGQAEQIQAELALLPAGQYRIVWLLEDDVGDQTLVDREFEIR